MTPRSDVLSIRVAFVVICVAVVLPPLGEATRGGLAPLGTTWDPMWLGGE